MQNLIIVPHARISAGSFFTNTHFRSLSMGPLIHIGIRKGILIERKWKNELNDPTARTVKNLEWQRLQSHIEVHEISIYEVEILINGVVRHLYLSEDSKFPLKDSELGAEILSNIALTADLLMEIIKGTENRTKDNIISTIKASLEGVK